MTWWSYVQKHSGTLSQREIAGKVGVDPSAISRWKRGGVPDAASAVSFARAFGRPVLEALIRAEVLDGAEAGAPLTSSVDATQLDDEDLISEMGRRLAGARRAAHRDLVERVLPGHTGQTETPVVEREVVGDAAGTAAPTSQAGDARTDIEKRLGIDFANPPKGADARKRGQDHPPAEGESESHQSGEISTEVP